MSSTTPPNGVPSRAPTGRPRIGIPTFSPDRPAPTPTTSTAGGDPAEGLAPREPGSHPGPGRDLPPMPPPMMTGTTSPAVGDVDEADDAAAGWLGFGTRRRERARRTTSSAGDGPSAEDVATALAAALVVLAGLSAWLVRLSTAKRWDLREPDDAETERVAKPLARILERRVGTAFLVPDLVDGVAAAAGVQRYVATDPLYRRAADAPAADPADPDLASHGYQEP